MVSIISLVSLFYITNRVSSYKIKQVTVLLPAGLRDQTSFIPQIVLDESYNKVSIKNVRMHAIDHSFEVNFIFKSFTF